MKKKNEEVDEILEGTVNTGSNVEYSTSKAGRAPRTKEEQEHIDARDARVKTINAAIEEAKIKRDEAFALGVTETEGAKLDRETKENKDLEEASVINKIEPFSITSTNPDMVILADKLNEVIKLLNK